MSLDISQTCHASVGAISISQHTTASYTNAGDGAVQIAKYKLLTVAIWSSSKTCSSTVKAVRCWYHARHVYQVLLVTLKFDSLLPTTANDVGSKEKRNLCKVTMTHARMTHRMTEASQTFTSGQRAQAQNAINRA